MEIEMGRIGLPVIDSDFSELEGSRCYCDYETSVIIRNAIENLPLQAVHMLGSGDRHYVSYFWTEKILEPFSLILLDNHPDDRKGSFGDELLSCGGWVRNVRELPCCKGTVWYDGNGEAFRQGAILKKAYLSIDLDILDMRYYKTNWNQGSLSPDDLFKLVGTLSDEYDLAGIDICGAPDASQRLTSCEKSLNRRIIDNLLSTLSGNIGRT